MQSMSRKHNEVSSEIVYVIQNKRGVEERTWKANSVVSGQSCDASTDFSNINRQNTYS
jgi:hypothetical protein